MEVYLLFFSRKLFNFGAYANFLHHFDCSHGVLAAFCNSFFYFRKQISLLINEGSCLELALALFLLTIWISDCWCWAHIATRNQDKFTVSFISRRKFFIFFFGGSCSNLQLMQILFIILIAVMVYWQYFVIVFFISGSKFLSPSMKAVV